jgi:osmoprotectant transport system ATP-binding protein
VSTTAPEPAAGGVEVELVPGPEGAEEQPAEATKVSAVINGARVGRIGRILPWRVRGNPTVPPRPGHVSKEDKREPLATGHFYAVPASASRGHVVAPGCGNAENAGVTFPVRLEGVTKRQGSFVLGPLTMDLPARGTLSLVGPSGAGKSTILRAVVGLTPPDEGQILVDGERMTAQSAPKLRRRIGYVIQDGGLFPHLSARDNAAIVARHIGWGPDRVARRVDELAAMLRLEPRVLAGYPLQLSGGERQRVALMRALFLDPDVLLLDEPFGALDVLVRARLQEELRAIVRELGKTVMLVTHDLGEAALLTDRFAILREGRIVAEDTTASLHGSTDPFVAQFVEAQRRLAV